MQQVELQLSFAGLTGQQIGVGYATQFAPQWKFTAAANVILFQESGDLRWQLMPRVGVRYSPYRLGLAPVFGASGSILGAWGGALITTALASEEAEPDSLYLLGAPLISPRFELGVQQRFERWEVSAGLSADVFFYVAVGNEESPEIMLLQPWIRVSYRF